MQDGFSSDFIRLIFSKLSIALPAEIDHDEFFSSFADTIRSRFDKPNYPNPGESLALTLMKSKTAALAFDRVYAIPGLKDPVPAEIGFYCATTPEIACWGYSMILVALESVGIKTGCFDKQPNNIIAAENEKKSLKLVCSEFQRKFGIMPTVFFQERDTCNEEMGIGPNQVLVAAMANVALVDEEQLTWEQVVEVRKDTDSHTKYRRLIRWVDTELQTKSPKEVEDLIAFRLDDYEWALRKHGLKAAVGTLSCLLDPKFLGGASATIAATALTGSGYWTALAGASLVVGRAIVSFGTSAIDGLDERRKENYEVAYIHELKRRLK